MNPADNTDQNRCPVCGHVNQAQARFCGQCGGGLAVAPRAPTAALLSNGSVIQGRYQVLGLLGQGGMGGVYEVSDLRLGGRRMALKVLSDAALVDSAAKAQAAGLFRQEAELLGRLDHPNIPKVTDFFVETGRFCLVMERVEGVTLAELLARQGRVCTEAEVRGWADQLCTVLAYLHGQTPAVVFRDLKPGNIMLATDGRIKLIDFGIARLFKPGKAGDTSVIGTPGFAAPEQYGLGQTDARSDIYSLGVVLHHLLTGHDPLYTPFNLPPVSQLNPGVSVELAQIIGVMTRADPAQRYQSIGQVQAALHGRGTAKAMPGPQPAAANRTWLWVALGLLLLVAIGAGALALANSGREPTWTPQPVAQVAAATSDAGEQAPVASRSSVPPAATDVAGATRQPEPPSKPTSALVVADTPAPAPTYTDPPTYTPRPTYTPYPTNTPEFTATPQPTSTPEPTVTPRCPSNAHPDLAGGWDRAVLGCPQGGAAVTWAAWQPFERGYMLWRSDTDVAAAFYDDGGWTAFAEKWKGDPVPSRGDPPPGLVAPARGFGFIWGRRDEVATRLGWGLDQEKGFCALVQRFERGYLLRSRPGPPCQGDLFNRANEPSFRQFGQRASDGGTWSGF